MCADIFERLINAPTPSCCEGHATQADGERVAVELHRPAARLSPAGCARPDAVQRHRVRRPLWIVLIECSWFLLASLLVSHLALPLLPFPDCSRGFNCCLVAGKKTVRLAACDLSRAVKRAHQTAIRPHCLLPPPRRCQVWAGHALHGADIGGRHGAVHQLPRPVEPDLLGAPACAAGIRRLRHKWAVSAVYGAKHDPAVCV